MALVFEDCISVALRLSFASCLPGERFLTPTSTPTDGMFAFARIIERCFPNIGIGMRSAPNGKLG